MVEKSSKNLSYVSHKQSQGFLLFLSHLSLHKCPSLFGIYVSRLDGICQSPLKRRLPISLLHAASIFSRWGNWPASEKNHSCYPVCHCKWGVVGSAVIEAFGRGGLLGEGASRRRRWGVGVLSLLLLLSQPCLYCTHRANRGGTCLCWFSLGYLVYWQQWRYNRVSPAQAVWSLQGLDIHLCPCSFAAICIPNVVLLSGHGVDRETLKVFLKEAWGFAPQSFGAQDF